MQLCSLGDNARTWPIPILRVEKSLFPIAKLKNALLAQAPDLLGIPRIGVYS